MHVQSGTAAPGAPPAPPAKEAPALASQDGSQQLTTAMLANATDEQQKNMIGERLFPKVQELQVGTPFVKLSPANFPVYCPVQEPNG